MKKIEDYIHLYIGCDVQWTRSDGAKLISKLTLSDAGWLKRRDEIKLLLRPLSSMTEEEAKDIWDKCMPNGGYRHNHKNRLLCSTHTIIIASPLFPELLSKSFDLFGLIDSGLALDATKLEGYGK